jgi:hypothetical protein
MKKTLFLYLLLSSLAFSQEKENRFPIRLKTIQLHYAEYNFGLDVINMFSDHLKIEPESRNNIFWSVDLRIMSFLDLLYSRETYTLNFPKSDNYTFDKYEYDYEKYQYGFRLHLYNIALEFGSGSRQFHTFIETDTPYYFHRELAVPFTFINLNYTYATSLFFDMNIFYEQVFFNTTQIEDIIMDEGDQKNFGLKLIFGSRYQIAPFFTHSYSNLKLIHKYFGLRNEMNNKFFEEKMGLSFIYNY